MHRSRIAFLVVSFFQLLSIPSFSQEKFTVSGYVKDGATGEYMMAANVYVIETQKGTTTNGYGFYSITLPKGKYKLKFSFIGYQDLTKDVELNGNTTLNVQLNPDSYQIDEIEVVADGAKENTNSTDMGRVGLDVEKIKTLPAFMGEVDIMKTIQLLPGVQAAGEGNSGFYVRGGGPDQNLILLDEAVVYNASHLFGFFSVFNADAVRNVELY
ncbi:MAG TPA: TonB-dependent receptor, partial [Flavobacteriales bacterium]|nr:TonB-dependent receptor [Flavobacteriales bacterium]